MNICCVIRSPRPAEPFSFGLLDGLPVRLYRPYVREAQAGFGLERLAHDLRIIRARSLRRPPQRMNLLYQSTLLQRSPSLRTVIRILRMI